MTITATNSDSVDRPTLSVVAPGSPSSIEERVARLEAEGHDFRQRYLHLLQMMYVVGGSFQATAQALLDEVGT